jgi:HEAT repeat protein
LGGESVVQRLMLGLADEQAHVRELAALALVELGGDHLAAMLADALASEHAEVRFQAALGCVEAPDPTRHVEVLVALLDDRDARVRKAAALSLARLGDARGGAQLGAALRDPDFALDALDALAAIGQAAQADAIAAIAQRVLIAPVLKAAAARALVRLGDERGVTALREVLRGLRGDARSYAVEAVGELQVHELAGELVRLSRRPRGTDPLTLVAALAALAPNSPQARGALETMAGRKDAAGERARELLNQA